MEKTAFSRVIKEIDGMFIYPETGLMRPYSMEKEMATHSSILGWRIPWTEEPGGLQSTGSQRVGHDWATSLTHSLTYSMDIRDLQALGI